MDIDWDSRTSAIWALLSIHAEANTEICMVTKKQRDEAKQNRKKDSCESNLDEPKNAIFPSRYPI